MPRTKNLENKTNSGIVIFGIVSAVWLILGEVSCWALNPNPEQAFLAYRSFLGFWCLSVLDLGILAKFLSSAGYLMNANETTRSAYAVQAIVWGVGKIVCLGLFVLVLLKGHEIPMHSLLLGMGTLVVVPLAGGFIWSQRVLQNA
ncbi:MAG: hypothetical protein ABIQ95_14090 [Bdellovibrionia bacterium]